jgi:hypothetical protein
VAVKSRTGLAIVEWQPNKPKKTKQGHGKNSKPRGTRKLPRGQGR